MSTRKEVVIKFWDVYQAEGAGEALLYITKESDDNMDHVKDSMQYLLVEARERNIDVVKFIQEMGDFVTENLNAPRINNGGAELPPDSSVEDNSSQDEDEPSKARDADGEDQSANESSTSS